MKSKRAFNHSLSLKSRVPPRIILSDMTVIDPQVAVRRDSVNYHSHRAKTLIHNF